jgi:hypothetical protein
MKRLTDNQLRAMGYVAWWWQREEFADQIGDYQATSVYEIPGADLVGQAAATAAMFQSPIGEPPTDFDVRCVFDSRIVNGYDFNFSAAIAGTSSAGWSATFTVPNGYRIVPREWTVQFDNVFSGASANSTATIEQQGAAVPYNQNIIIGMGTDEPIKTFFLCEENTTFGIAGFNGNAITPYTGSITVYGNLIPVTDVALPLSVSNQQKMLGVGVPT